MRRALLLDAGNTLVYLDHEAVGEVAGLPGAALAAAERAAKRRYEVFLAEEGASHEDGWFLFMRCLLEEAGAEGGTAAIEARVLALRAAHDEHNLWRRVPEGLPEALERLRAAGWALGVVSNSEGRLGELFERGGLGGRFEVVIDSGVVGVRKPDPRIFAMALEALEVPAERAVYAGDIPDVDVEGARAAGIEGVLVDTAGHYPEYAAAPRYAHTVDLVEALLRR